MGHSQQTLAPRFSRQVSLFCSSPSSSTWSSAECINLDSFGAAICYMTKTSPDVNGTLTFVAYHGGYSFLNVHLCRQGPGFDLRAFVVSLAFVPSFDIIAVGFHLIVSFPCKGLGFLARALVVSENLHSLTCQVLETRAEILFRAERVKISTDSTRTPGPHTRAFLFSSVLLTDCECRHSALLLMLMNPLVIVLAERIIKVTRTFFSFLLIEPGCSPGLYRFQSDHAFLSACIRTPSLTP